MRSTLGCERVREGGLSNFLGQKSSGEISGTSVGVGKGEGSLQKYYLGKVWDIGVEGEGERGREGEMEERREGRREREKEERRERRVVRKGKRERMKKREREGNIVCVCVYVCVCE